jgi:hypothetical protein
MKKTYKLAHNFNTVEFELEDNDVILDSYVLPEEIVDYDENLVPVHNVDRDELVLRFLKKEYDILAQIAPAAAPAATRAPAEPFEPASQSQISWAKNLGMADADKRSKREVFAYIQAHKK